MTPKRLKNRLTNLLFVVLGAVLSMILFLAAYFLSFYFFSHRNNNSGLALKAPTVASAVSSSTPSESNTPPLNPVIREQPPVVDNFTATPSVTETSPPISPNSPPTLPSNLPPNVLDPSLTFGSFYDTFSSDAGLDLTKTDLYQDKIATAMFFPPDYEWQSAPADTVASLKSYVDAVNLNDFNGPYKDRRCLGDNCLEQDNNDLYYNGQHLFLPDGLRSTDVLAVSIATVGQRWLVGFTLKDGSKYQGQVFYLDGATGAGANGAKFTALDLPTISSSYFGLFGFGGEENDFLIIYGAYKGIAYRVQPDKITDLSSFFDIRVMNGGFKAEAFKTVYQDNINWYVFSSTTSRPQLIKLWQNQTPDIAGEASFADLLFSPTTESAVFKPLEAKADRITLLAKVRSDNVDSWQTFTDRGFKNTNPGTLVFNPISRAAGATFSLQKIATSRLDIDAASGEAVKLWFSADGQNWREVPAGENIDFTTPALNNFFLKVTFNASAAKFYSPFLASVLFDYYFKK